MPSSTNKKPQNQCCVLFSTNKKPQNQCGVLTSTNKKPQNQCRVPTVEFEVLRRTQAYWERYCSTIEAQLTPLLPCSTSQEPSIKHS